MSLLRIAIGLVGWAALLYGALTLRRVPGEFSYLICGPWGCGPSLQSLVACHTFWLVLIGPPLWVVGGRWSLSGLRLATAGIWFVVIAGVLVTCIWQIVTWIPSFPGGTELAWQNYWQRCLFVLATMVEVPLLPLAIASLPLLTRSLQIDGEVTLPAERLSSSVAERTDPPSAVRQEPPELHPAAARR